MERIKVQKFDVQAAREFIEWLISLDAPQGQGFEDRKTVTLTKIIEKAKATLSDAEYL